jgi:lipoprotein-anchoring transpeptidase ErfK/SrfK
VRFDPATAATVHRGGSWRVWQVPNSPWAGALAGRTIPPGPEDPLKARWMGFDGSAGIHGTDDVSSLGTAASRGCIRMAIPDVEQLYAKVQVHTPVYII